MYTATVGHRGVEALEEYRELSLEEAVRQRFGMEDERDVRRLRAEAAGPAADADEAVEAAAVVLPYAHEGNLRTASGNPEDFLPVSAGGKLKDKNHRVRGRRPIASSIVCVPP